MVEDGPDGREPVSEQEAEFYIASVCFKTGPPGPVGIEVERLVHHRGDHRAEVPVAEVGAALGPTGSVLPGGGRLSFEPGGQVEASTACAAGLADLLPRARADLAAVDRLLGAGGLVAGPLALDPCRPARRSLQHPRYAAMQRYFDAAGPAGRTMMCSTASLQVCVEAGPDSRGVRQRWDRVHLLLPVLAAMFANSPFQGGRPTGWKSSRLRVWAAIDPARTEPVPLRDPRADPAQAWARYALDAPLLCIRPAGDGEAWDAPPGLTLRGWLRTRQPRPATLADVAYHLTTLFPPVRPRGFLELRTIDAQAGSDGEAATAITTALIDDAAAAGAAEEACAPLAGLPGALEAAARRGLSDPRLAEAAGRCGEAALTALPRLGVDGAGRARAQEFAEAYTFRGRCPADERLERWQGTGELCPTPEEGPPLSSQDPERQEAAAS